MDRFFRFGTVLVGVLVVSMLASSAAAAEAAGDDSAVLPYLDDGTLFVARLDVDRVDSEALGKYMEQAFDTMLTSMPIPPNQQGAVKAQMMQSVAMARSWVTDMAAAGGKRVYVLLDVADLTGGNDEPAVIVPLGEGADAEQIRGVLTRNNRHPENVVEIGKAVVFAEPPQIERLRNRVAGAPIDRPDLARAFAAAGIDSPLRVALAPGEPARRWVEENLAQLPEQLGGGDTKILSRGVRYASIGVAQKPGTMANLAIRCEDADKAKALFDVINKGTTFVRGKIPAKNAEEANEQIDAIKPSRAGDTITVSVDPLVVQMALMGVRMQARAEVQVGNGKAAPAEPAKQDDGGL